MFAWEAYEQGSDVHLQADPTKLELLHKTYKVKKDNYKEDQKEGVLAKVCCTLSTVFLNFCLEKYAREILSYWLWDNSLAIGVEMKELNTKSIVYSLKIKLGW